ncbi:unnamed protein product [Cylindrotheca closterium]|uniref:Uncharacterized protein n=1 Tax=Cylindrotheca closterium TaxID=2856 RepID=A0AAD2FRA4_9STRA|nr:unnamed protein product [Cylindrotheca closterium]
MFPLRSIIMIFFLLAMQPMAKPSLMSANYTRPSIQVSSLAKENVISIVDFVGTTVEMESTIDIAFFSFMEIIQSINYESIKTFAEEFNKKYEAFTDSISDAMSPIFEVFSKKYEASIQSINYESIKALAEVLNEQFESCTREVPAVISARFDMISFEYQQVYEKLVPFATYVLAAAPAWPTGSFDPNFIVRDVFEGMESYTTKDSLVPAPIPPLISYKESQSIAIKFLEAISFGAIGIALLVIAVVILRVIRVINRELIVSMGVFLFSEQVLVIQAAFIALKLKEKKAASVKGSTRRPDMSNGAAIAELCDLCANTSPLKDTTTNDPSKNESF